MFWKEKKNLIELRFYVHNLCDRAEFTRSTSQVQARVKFESFEFDCDSFFHDDVPVVNSKIIKQSGLRSRSIDHERHSELQFEDCFSKIWQVIVFINFPERMWPLFA